MTELKSDLLGEAVDGAINVLREVSPSSGDKTNSGSKQDNNCAPAGMKREENVAREELDKSKMTENNSDVQGKKKKRRRGKPKRRWKPYYKLSWKERQEVEEREAQRANRIRAERFAQGQPVAPYNTTQFLMEDHNVRTPNFEHIRNRQNVQRENSMESDDYYSSPEDEDDFLRQQFSEVYENIHAERLSSMSKDELVQEYIQLEDRVEELESKLRETKTSLNNDISVSSVECPDRSKEEEEWEKIKIYREEIEKLEKENERLRLENEMLRKKFVELESTETFAESCDDSGVQQDRAEEETVPKIDESCVFADKLSVNAKDSEVEESMVLPGDMVVTDFCRSPLAKHSNTMGGDITSEEKTVSKVEKLDTSELHSQDKQSHSLHENNSVSLASHGQHVIEGDISSEEKHQSSELKSEKTHLSTEEQYALSVPVQQDTLCF